MKFNHKFKENQGQKELPAGFYKCQITNVNSKLVNNVGVLSIEFDICEGEHKYYYSTKYKAFKERSENAFYQGKIDLFEKNQNGGSTGFDMKITSLKNMNKTVNFVTENEIFEEKMKGMKFIGVFQRIQNKTGFWETSCVNIIDEEKKETYKIPEDKPNSNLSNDSSFIDYGMIPVDEGDMPF